MALLTSAPGKVIGECIVDITPRITFHPHVIGYRSRIWILEKLIEYTKSHPHVWFTTHAEVVQWAKHNGT
jgi:hypothetical protein